MEATGDKRKTLSWRRGVGRMMNREEAARVLSSMRDTLKKVYLVAIDEERISAIEAAVGYLLAEDNNVPVKQPDPITGLVPCGCGGKVEQEDFHDGFFPYSRVTCRGCWTETTRCRGTTEEAHEMARIGWNASHGYTAPPLPGAKEQSYES